MALSLYDTYARKKRPFQPRDPKRVTLYVCGPTVYNYAHIGNARPAVVFDTLFRLLRRLYGAKAVIYARNVTDVDDKINQAAIDQGVDISVITDKFTAIYNQDMAALGVLAPTIEPHATQHIAEMQNQIGRLVEAGNAYPAEGHVLFDTTSFADYGKLSGRTLEDMIAGARVEVAPYKKNPHDFVLWKPSKADEPSWPSPWGEGRPGWHIECSAMIEETLGLPIDIHGGGIDLVFPHHENEIAQGVCAHGHAHSPDAHVEYSRYWMHNGFLTVDAEKMSKSIGNVLLLHDLVQTIPGEVVRWALLSAHYRQPLDWNQALLDQSRKALDRLYGALHRAAAVEANGDEPAADFLAAIEDDINTPGAMATLFALSSEIERAMTAGDLGVAGRAKGELIAAGAILGVLQATPADWLEGEVSGDLRTEVESLLEQRAAARAGKDWAEADRIRDRLNALNVVVMDGPQGATWRVRG